MKGFILKPHEAQALAAGKPVVIWRVCKPPKWVETDRHNEPHWMPMEKGDGTFYFVEWSSDEGREHPLPVPFPVGVPLFGKETWSADAFEISYKERVGEWVKAVPEEHKAQLVRLYDTQRMSFRPPSHMPEWASRIILTLSNVKVRRPCDVTEEEAKAMGVSKYPWMATALNPETMKLETDDRHCRRVFGEIFHTQHGNAAWNLYHFTALATPQHKEP